MRIQSINTSLFRLTRVIQVALWGCGLLLIGTVFYVGQLANQSAIDREQQLVRNALDYSINSRLSKMRGVAWWNEGARRISIDRDAAWATEQVAAWLMEPQGLDEVYVFDGDDRPLIATVDGQNPGLEEQVALRRPLIQPIIEEIRGRAPLTRPDRLERFAAEQRNDADLISARLSRWAGRIMSRDGRPVAVVGMNIVPSTDAFPTPGRPAPILITITPLNEQMIRQIGAFLLLNDLRWTPTVLPGASASRGFTTDDGRALGYLSWTGRQPGSTILHVILPLVCFAIILIWAFSTVILRRLWRASRALAESESKARHQALHDPLSDLPNRRHFTEALHDIVGRGHNHQEGRHQLLLAYIDVDRFKDVNDAIGHDAGDQLVTEVGRRLKALAGPEDVLARLGGDEFAILRMMVPGERPERLGDAIMSAFHRPFSIGDARLEVSASVGLAAMPQAEADADRLLQDADISLYRAKDRGRGCYVLFADDMANEVKRRHQIVTDLRGAIGTNQIHIEYQPIVNVRTNLITAVEALVRWRHPQIGAIGPGQFIPVAEQCGMMIGLGNQLLDAIFRDAAYLPDIEVALNLSPVQLRQGDLPAHLSGLAQRYGVDPRRIVIEVTESTLIDADEAVSRTFDSIRRLGFKMALDDFGTGYSSMSYLHRFDFDKIKIDRSFVGGAGAAKLVPIIQAIVHIGRGFHMETIAEGIEVPGELALLKTLGVSSAQGFLFSPPLALANVIDFIRDNRTRRPDPDGDRLFAV